MKNAVRNSAKMPPVTISSCVLNCEPRASGRLWPRLGFGLARDAAPVRLEERVTVGSEGKLLRIAAKNKEEIVKVAFGGGRSDKRLLVATRNGHLFLLDLEKNRSEGL